MSPLGYNSWSAVNEENDKLARDASAAYAMSREIGVVSSDQSRNASRAAGDVV